jgi:hypothetical protein
LRTTATISITTQYALSLVLLLGVFSFAFLDNFSHVIANLSNLLFVNAKRFFSVKEASNCHFYPAYAIIE